MATAVDTPDLLTAIVPAAKSLRHATAARPIRIACVIWSLDVGGAERVAATFAGDWARRGHCVSLVTLRVGLPDFYNLDPAVERIRLDLAGESRGAGAAVRANIRRIRALRRIFRELQPDIIVSFMSSMTVNCVIAAMNLKARVVAFETTDPTNRQRRSPLIRRLLTRLAYARASRVVVLAPTIRDGLSRWWPRPRMALIPTPVPEELLRLAVPGPVAGRPRIVALGRLSVEKGFDRLLDAFARIAERFPDWDLWIWGEGAERGALQSQLSALGLDGRVFLPGQTRSPWEEVSRASLFVLPSRREGFPGALVEAMALGRACVAFDCRSGPREISRDGTDAVLVPEGDVEALAAALANLMRDPAQRDELGRRALAVRHRYHPAAISRLWEGLFRDVLAEGRSRDRRVTVTPR